MPLEQDMTGKAFEKQLERWHKDIDCWTRKWPDWRSGCKTPAPCDRITVAKSGTFFFELKVVKGLLSMKHVERQLSVMMNLESLGANAWYCVKDAVMPKLYQEYFWLVRPSLAFEALTKKSVLASQIGLYVNKGVFKRLLETGKYQ